LTFLCCQNLASAVIKKTNFNSWLINLSGLKASLLGSFYLLLCSLAVLFTAPNTEFEGLYDLEIVENSNGSQVRAQLVQGQAIHNQLSFKLASWLLNFDQGCQPEPGLYQLESGWNNLKIINYLKSTPKPSVEVIIHPYQKRINTLRAICKELDIKHSALIAALEDEAYLKLWGHFDADNIYCLLAQDTFRVYRDVRARELAHQLMRRHLRFWTPQRLEQAAGLGLTPHEVTILASIVYAETKIIDEMPVIAGLYLNRLNQDMKLQADPTVVFASGKSLRRVLKVHQRIASKYNTYRHKGLPPGPVFTPSADAIDGVLNAKSHDYLYFCAKVDFSGSHHFSRTLAEHQQYAHNYQRALNKRRIGYKGS
jgi:UPF0755 protein